MGLLAEMLGKVSWNRQLITGRSLDGVTRVQGRSMMKVRKTRHRPVSISRRLSMVLGIVSVSAGVCDPSQEAPVSFAASAPAEKAPAQHDRLVADGIVERYLMDPRGDVEGLL